MKRLLIGMTAVALGAAPLADAKGLTQVRVCGPDACAAVEGPRAPAEWPANIDGSNGWTNYAPLADKGLNWRPWALAAGALMIALSAGGLIARRATTA